MPTSLTTLSGAIKIVANWNAQVSLAPGGFGPVQNTSAVTKNLAYGTSIPNNSGGGCDELVSYLIKIGNATGGVPTAGTVIVIQSGNGNTSGTLTDILNQAAISMVRIKGYLFQNLSSGDDSTNGTACGLSGQGIGIWQNSGAPFNIVQFSGTASIPAIMLGNGDAMCWGTQYGLGMQDSGPAALSGGFASGVLRAVYRTFNFDPIYSGVLQVTFFGATS